MGRAKAEMMRLHEMSSPAASAAIKAGAVMACPVHEDFLIDQYDDDAHSRAFAIGTNLWKDGAVDGIREEFMEAIKAVIDESGDECPSCAKYMED